MFNSFNSVLLYPSALLCMCGGHIKARTELCFSRTFIITLNSSQDLPQFLNTVENWFLNPSTAHKISAVKILKEPLLGLSGNKITQTHKKYLQKKTITCGTKICFLYDRVRQQRKQGSSKLFPEKVIELGWDYEASWSRAVQSCLFYIIYQHQIIFHN